MELQIFYLKKREKYPEKEDLVCKAQNIDQQPHDNTSASKK